MSAGIVVGVVVGMGVLFLAMGLASIILSGRISREEEETAEARAHGEEMKNER
jgi:hypothetical protein